MSSPQISEDKSTTSRSEQLNSPKRKSGPMSKQQEVPAFTFRPIKESRTSSTKLKFSRHTSLDAIPNPETFISSTTVLTRTKSSSIFRQLASSSAPISVSTFSTPPFAHSPEAPPPHVSEEMSQIDMENRDKIAAMSREEILREQQELLQRFGKDMIQKISHHYNKKEEASSKRVPDSSSSKNPTSFVDQSYSQLPPSEQRKLDWMKDTEPQEPLNTEDSKRLDLFGRVVVPNSDAEFQNELYHHGGPNIPGYTVEELCHLARSSMARQRSLALKALSGFFQHRLEEPNVYRKVPFHQGQALMAIRMGLDFEETTSLALAAEALFHFLLSKEEMVGEDSVRGLKLGYMEWGVLPRRQGSPLIPGAPCLDFYCEDDLKNQSEEEFNPVQLAELSPVIALVRTSTLDRLVYLLTTCVLDQKTRWEMECVLLFLSTSKPLPFIQQQQPFSMLSLGLVNRNKECCLRFHSQFDFSCRDWEVLRFMVLILRSCVLHGYFLESIPKWMQSLMQVVEDVLELTNPTPHQIDCACAVFDVVSLWLPSGDDGAFDVSAIVNMAQHIATSGRALSLGAASIRFLESHAKFDVNGSCQRSFHATLIFAGRFVGDDEVADHNVFWDALETCLHALVSFCQVEAENASYLAAIELFKELWNRTFASSLLPTPIPRNLPQGMLFLNRNLSVLSVLQLNTVLHSFQAEEDRLQVSEWQRQVFLHISNRLGGHSSMTMSCIKSLLASFELNVSLLEQFEMLLLPEMDDEEEEERLMSSFITCSNLERNFKIFARLGVSWPAMLLLQPQQSNNKEELENGLVFLHLVKQWMDVRAVYCLIEFAVNRKLQSLTLSHEQDLCALFDFMFNKKAAPSFVSLLSFFDGQARLQSLAKEIATKFTEQLHFRSFLGRCVVLFLQADCPLDTRIMMWRYLGVSKSYDALLDIPPATNFGEENEIIQEMANSLTGERPLEKGWMFDGVACSLKRFFSSKPSSWLAQRLLEELKDVKF